MILSVNKDRWERFALIKVELFQEERRLLDFGEAILIGKKTYDRIWVNVEIVEKLPQIPIVA